METVAPLFVRGGVYQSTTHGLVEYKGTDICWGNAALHFFSVGGGADLYWLPEELGEHFKQ